MAINENEKNDTEYYSGTSSEKKLSVNEVSKEVLMLAKREKMAQVVVRKIVTQSNLNPPIHHQHNHHHAHDEHYFISCYYMIFEEKQVVVHKLSAEDACLCLNTESHTHTHTHTKMAIPDNETYI